MRQPPKVSQDGDAYLRDRGFDVVMVGDIQGTGWRILSSSTDRTTRTGRALWPLCSTPRPRRIPRQSQVSRCHRSRWRRLAPASAAVLPVTVRTPRRCPCRGSFVSRPRRHVRANESARNDAIRGAVVGVKSPAPPACSGMRFTKALQRAREIRELRGMLGHDR